MSIAVLEKISQVMGKIQFLKKDGHVKFGTTDYRYLGEGKITENIRKACLSVGLLIVPVKAEHLDSSIGTIAKIKITYRIYDKDSGEYIDTEMVGYGADSHDKSIYKAITGCYKYLQRQLFAIPTNETDPDKVSSEELTDTISQAEKKKWNEKAKVIMELAKGKGKTKDDVSKFSMLSFKIPFKDLTFDQLEEVEAKLKVLPNIEKAVS